MTGGFAGPAACAAPGPPGAPLERGAAARGVSRPVASAAEASPFPLAPRAAYGLALACGCASLLAFPGLDVWPLAFVSFVPLAIALRGQPAGQAFRLGWTAAFAGKLGAFYWMVGLLRDIGGLPLPVCLLAFLLLCAWQAGRFGLHGWLACRAAARGWPAPLAFAAAFVASEQVYPLLFPWSFAASVHDVPLLVQSAELGGPIAVGLVLLCSNLAVAELLIARLERRPVAWRPAAGLLSVPLLALLYGQARMAQVDRRVAQAPSARVGLVQADMRPSHKEQDPAEGLRRHLALTRRLQQQGPLDLVVWSETALAEPLWERAASTRVETGFAAALGVPLLFGAVLARPVGDARGHVVFNSALLADGRGRLVGRYDKQRLLPFSETLPLGPRFPALYRWMPRGARGAPGGAGRPLRLGQREIATFICYEDILPDLVNGIVRRGQPALLVNLTNDAWFGDTTEPWIHLALARLRAVEQRRFFLRATNTGISALVDPAGRILERTRTFVQDARRVEVRWLTGRTPYQLWGDAPWWLVASAVAVGAFSRGTRASRSGTPP